MSPKAVHSGGSNGPITYSILSGNERGIFSIQPSTGKEEEQRKWKVPWGSRFSGPEDFLVGGVALRERGSRTRKGAITDAAHLTQEPSLFAQQRSLTLRQAPGYGWCYRRRVEEHLLSRC